MITRDRRDAGREADPADRQVGGLVAQQPLAQPGAAAVEQVGGLLRIGALEQADELLAAIARDRHPAAQVLAQEARDEAEHAVAGMVAVPVVDRLEIVDVAQREGKGGGIRPGQRLLHPREEAAAIGQAGEVILLRLAHCALEIGAQAPRVLAGALEPAADPARRLGDVERDFEQPAIGLARLAAHLVGRFAERGGIGAGRGGGVAHRGKAIGDLALELAGELVELVGRLARSAALDDPFDIAVGQAALGVEQFLGRAHQRGLQAVEETAGKVEVGRAGLQPVLEQEGADLFVAQAVERGPVGRGPWILAFAAAEPGYQPVERRVEGNGRAHARAPPVHAAIRAASLPARCPSMLALDRMSRPRSRRNRYGSDRNIRVNPARNSPNRVAWPPWVGDSHSVNRHPRAGGMTGFAE